MNSFDIKNNNVGVKIHAKIIEDGAKAQVDLIASHPAIRDLIAIMPDVHQGVGCVIGFTGKFKKSVIPNIVGVDIGCGVLSYRLKTKGIDFAKLDANIRRDIPLGFASRNFKSKSLFEVMDGLPDGIKEDIDGVATIANDFLEKNNIKGKNSPFHQVGTLGGGNHFIEIEKGDSGELFLTIHSGSRNFGLKVATFYQQRAKMLMGEMNIQVPNDLEYLPYSFGGNEYLQTVNVAQQYAHYNRLVMLNIILKSLGEEYNSDNIIESVHNYIGKDNVIRKGAISAFKDEKVVIPLNMGAGIVLGIGKGNKDYNNSAPHGSGRLYGRKEMFRRFDSGMYNMEKFQESMKGIFSTSLRRDTFDESPFAYKQFSDIEEFLRETVDVVQIAKPVYNLKAPGDN